MQGRRGPRHCNRERTPQRSGMFSDHEPLDRKVDSGSLTEAAACLGRRGARMIRKPGDLLETQTTRHPRGWESGGGPASCGTITTDSTFCERWFLYASIKLKEAT